LKKENQGNFKLIETQIKEFNFDEKIKRSKRGKIISKKCKLSGQYS